MITVQDTTNPVLSGVPADTDVNCNEVPPTPDVNDVIATDNCDTDVEVTFNEVITPGGCTDSYTITRTWTATDNCGNQDVQTQTISVGDAAAPEIAGVPTDLTVECDNVPAAASPTATDDCDTDVDLTYSEVRADGVCLDSYTLTRTWTATDNCGNQSVETQVVTVQDTTNPTLVGVPADTDVSCNEVPPVPSINDVTATDNCDTDVDVTFNEVITPGACQDSYTITRTWTATDNCGNQDVQAQTIVVGDAAAPEIAGVPTDVTVECDNVPAAASPTATDDCDTDVDLIYSEVRADGACLDSYTLTRTWTASDNCGNQSVETQVVTVQDTTNPVLSGVPADTNVSCNEVPPTPDANDVTATDNCDTNVDVTFNEVITPGACQDSYTITRTWTATDNCGNQDVQTQTISVGDAAAPEITGVPTDVTVECDNVPAAAAPIATDDCDTNVDITFSEVTIDGVCLDSYTLVRTWKATDNCGNVAEAVQTITVQDTTEPTLSGVPGDLNVSCNQVPPTPDVNDVIATDNCDTDVDVTFTENIIDGGCADSYTIVRTWTATDNCGNQNVQTQTISVGDAAAPTLTGVPTDATVECDNVPTAASPTATDDCDTDVDVVYNENTLAGACQDSYTLVRTWTATDNCGNQTVETQNILVQDTTNPELIGVPNDVNVSCNEVPPTPSANDVTGTDNCDTDVDVTFNETTTPGACPDSYTITRTWTATDNCGNQTIGVQTINVGDFDAPELAGVPNDTTVECDNVPAAANPTATDACDTNVDITYSEVRTDGGCVDSYTLTRTWTASDNCGNQTVLTQVVTVQDTTNPILTGVPADVTLSCDAITTPADNIIATDNCDTDVDVVYSEQTSGGGCAGDFQIIRTWTATDNCGNQTVATQAVSVQDDEAPILTGVPSNETVECDNVPAPATPTATDDCDTDVNITFNEVRTDGACLDSYTLTRTWTASDDCGNQDVQTQVITVQDTTDPILVGVPASETVECDEIPAVPTTGITATDNCDTDVDVVYEESTVAGSCENNYTIIRKWTATDNCGNAVEGIQEIIVQDTEAPILSGVPSDVTIECDETPASATPTATDNCDTDVMISYDEMTTPGACINEYTITRTWTASDNCGNQDVQTQTITVVDTTNPTLIGVPADINVSCTGVPPSTDVNVEATDNCDTDVDIVFTENQIDGQCAGSYILVRTWTATDNCGNQDVQTQTVTVGDEGAPVITGVPADVTVECDAIPAVGTPMATDDCDSDMVGGFNETIIDGDCADSYTIIRTWTATDDCGNVASATQTITVQDTTAPTFTSVPDDIDADCGGAIPPASDLTATDNCDTDVEVTFVENTTPGQCAGSSIIVRTWTATDNCGNSTSVTQTINTNDSGVPVISGVPADTTVECDAIPAPANPTAFDECQGDVAVTFSEEITPGACQDAYTITRTWTATDDCGNVAQETQVIAVQDTTNPVFGNVPADATADCNGQIPDPVTVTASDNCDTDVDVVLAETTAAGQCAGSYTLTRTWTATDNCGNTAQAVQTITVGDATAPLISGVPADETVECGNIPAPATPTATDECDDDITVTLDEEITSGQCVDNYIITRTWTAVDDCGNVATETQTITVQDTTNPVFDNVPADVTANCNDQAPTVVNPTATDNCDTDVDITFEETTTPGQCAGAFIITRTWTATDNCGNTAQATQTITVGDGGAPELTGIPSDLTVECDAIPAPATPTATDDCDTDIQITFVEVEELGPCKDTYTLTRTWTATDDCGNVTVETQTINVQDTTNPVLVGVPDDVVADCNATIPSVPNVTGTDNCDNIVDITFEENTTPGQCANSFVITRTWTATDNCGNTAAATQTITIGDGGAPTFTNAPADATVECDAIPAPATLTATDDCDTNVDINYSESTSQGACENAYTITRTWTATDDCGNVSEAVQVVTVVDTTAPVFGTIPTNTSIECGEQVPAPATPTATDNCDNDVTITFDENIVDGDCANAYTIVRTWTATDNCGNTAEATQSIQIGDSTAPTITGVPADMTIECDEVPVSADPTATDNCDNDVTLSYDEIVMPGSCLNEIIITRTWTATDNCGNETVEEQIITVLDTTDPYFTNIPTDITVDNNGGIPTDTDLEALDNCDTNVEVEFMETQTPADCGYIITRTWTATDNCGNETTITQNITVNYTINIQTSTTNENCEIGNDGTATANVSNGTAPYDYEWSNGQTTQTATDLTAGSYIVTVTDANGCTAQAAVIIVEVGDCGCTVDAWLEYTSPESCDNGDGVAVFAPSAYDYEWSDGGTGSVREDLVDGTYTVTVTDDAGCTAEFTVTISEAPCDVNIGDYVWNDVDQDGIQDSLEPGVQGVMVKLIVAGDDGVFGTADDVIVMTETTDADGYYLFEGVAPGEYIIEFMENTIPNGYVLTDQDQGTNDEVDSDANPTTTQTDPFTVVAGQDDDLSFDAGIHLECLDVTNGGQIEADQDVCAGETVATLTNAATPIGGAGDLEYLWMQTTTPNTTPSTNNTAWMIIPGATSESYDPGQLYETTYFVRCVRREGCGSYVAESNIVTITVNPAPYISFDQAPTSACMNENVTFEAAISGAGAVYSWDFGPDATPSTADTRSVDVRWSTPGLHEVTLTVTRFGCSVSIPTSIVVEDCSGFFFIDVNGHPMDEEAKARIHWAARNEAMNSQYEIEHSVHGNEFESVGSMASLGTGIYGEANSYTFFHNKPNLGLNYYRIKYTDVNTNEIVYSKVIEITLRFEDLPDLAVYPNPFVDVFTVEILEPLEEDGTLEVVDALGRVLQRFDVPVGKARQEINMDHYAQGVYFIWIKYDDYRRIVHKVVKADQ